MIDTRMLDTFHHEFKKETDRASVILAAAMLESALESILKRKLVALPSGKDDIFEYNGPLGNFSSKIDICYRIGLISAKFTCDLHLIKKIRNSFAHDIRGCSFENESVRDRCHQLISTSNVDKKYPEFRKKLPDGPRGDFEASVSWMLWQLGPLSEDIKCFKEAPLEFGYSEHEK